MGILRNFLLLVFLVVGPLVHALAPEFLNEIHHATLVDNDFNKTYIKSGCFVRAHWIAEMIFKSGHEPLKVFIETISSKEKMHILLPSGHEVNWVFHVTAGFKGD
jgi:Glutaminase